MFIVLLFKILLFKGGVLIYAEHCKCITLYGSSHNSHEIHTNWLINVDNFVQRDNLLC